MFLLVCLLVLLWKSLRLIQESAKGRALSCPVSVIISRAKPLNINSKHFG